MNQAQEESTFQEYYVEEHPCEHFYEETGESVDFPSPDTDADGSLDGTACPVSNPCLTEPATTSILPAFFVPLTGAQQECYKMQVIGKKGTLEQDTAGAFQNIVRIEFQDFLMNNNNNNLQNYILEEFKNVR
ncbi:hypothetical protein DPMN_144635 [Dreissena polymorpha]|uniref:Uncharacterized protein n=1 Tax=Dreissena polymorpha TaxID=45954 RepID=A0A9D4F2H7_DREPO|nr:hypothetical protein DPMN_144635 [Dreissena polymorpha]